MELEQTGGLERRTKAEEQYAFRDEKVEGQVRETVRSKLWSDAGESCGGVCAVAAAVSQRVFLQFRKDADRRDASKTFNLL